MVATLQTGVLSTPTLFGLHPDEVLNRTTAEYLRQNKKLKENSDGTAIADTRETNLSEEDDDVEITFTKYDSIFDLIQDTKPERYIRSLSPNAWIRLDENRYILSDISGWLTLEKKDSNKNNNKSFIVKHVIKIKSTTESATPIFTRPRPVATAPDLETAVHAADTYAKEKFETRYISTRQAWRRNPATSSQLDMLNKAKIRDTRILSGELTRGQATDMITKLRFGGKKRFADLGVKRRAVERAETKKREFEELVRRSEVRVGPVEV